MVIRMKIDKKIYYFTVFAPFFPPDKKCQQIADTHV
ncbi:hypothetical protein Dub35A_001 [Lactococcus phage Dub35A]|nr:hypothetical protein Dub35A_001 [Lactococcus phage Dub35A]